MALKSVRSYGSDGLVEGLGLRTLFTFFSAKALRGGPKFIPQIAICAFVLLTLARLVPTRFSDIAFGSSYTKILKWTPSTATYDDGSISGGLRVVVFGGGDVATPSRDLDLVGARESSWTDVLCQQVDGCNSHISYMPKLDRNGGSVLSKKLYEATLDHVITSQNASAGPGWDYSWLRDAYPVPTHLPDLEEQIQEFLATPAPNRKPRETLWVFNYGYWDIWRLASIPRNLALTLMEVQLRQMFDNIEVLYQAARSEESIAYSDYYTLLDSNTAPSSENTTAVILDVPAEPFRIFIPSVFDVSLTPGFETARVKPPSPHSSAEEMRNAAYLTDEWEKLMTALLDMWLATPEPTVNTTSDETLLLRKRDASGNDVFVPNARREAITYDVPKYLKDIIVDRQLKEAEVQDHNGLGTKAEGEGFQDVSEPCMPINGPANATCATPREHLFWTEFTLGQQAIQEIGHSAAKRFKAHVQKGEQWLKKWQEVPELSPREFNG